MSAVFGGHADTVSLLLARGADVKMTTENDQTALQVARERQFKDVAAVLLNAGIRE
jgi:ankyrin repeat protein